jgi:hypothetical protein
MRPRDHFHNRKAALTSMYRSFLEKKICAEFSNITKPVCSFRNETFAYYDSVSAIFCDGQAIENRLGPTRRADAQPLAGTAHPGPKRILALPQGEAGVQQTSKYRPRTLIHLHTGRGTARSPPRQARQGGPAKIADRILCDGCSPPGLTFCEARSHPSRQGGQNDRVLND